MFEVYISANQRIIAASYGTDGWAHSYEMQALHPTRGWKMIAYEAAGEDSMHRLIRRFLRSSIWTLPEMPQTITIDDMLSVIERFTAEVVPVMDSAQAMTAEVTAKASGVTADTFDVFEEM